MRRSDFDILRIKTNNTALIWKEARGIAPDSVADKMDDAMLSWMVELTDTLKLWIDKGLDMTDGELILARTNMGALVESWLKFFYCAFYEDYLNNPMMQRNRMVEPNKMKFEDLKNFSIGILFENNQDALYLWIDKIQHYRNAVHAFNYRDIGTTAEFITDMGEYNEYVDKILNKVPSVEDYIECYPAGYISKCLF